jgi:D-glycero-D-manno-heptose 1,7-bisphosphate phosphatase
VRRPSNENGEIDDEIRPAVRACRASKTGLPIALALRDRTLDNVEMNRRGVFLDLNGTLVEPLKQERLDELTLIPGVADAVARLTTAGFVCPVITVQSRIAKGLFSMVDFQGWFATFAADLEAQGALVVGPYVCPHRFAEPCPCKKPNVVLYERAACEHQLNAADCFVIGDSPDDVRAARRLGARGCLVRTGWASDPRVVETATQDATIVADSFVQAIDWILGLGRRSV